MKKRAEAHRRTKQLWPVAKFTPAREKGGEKRKNQKAVLTAK